MVLSTVITTDRRRFGLIALLCGTDTIRNIVTMINPQSVMQMVTDHGIKTANSTVITIDPWCVTDTVIADGIGMRNIVMVTTCQPSSAPTICTGCNKGSGDAVTVDRIPLIPTAFACGINPANYALPANDEHPLMT